MTFSDFNLSSAITDAVSAQFSTPTEIQKLAVPAVLAGKDLLALAQTGSGKTLAFGLPILQAIDCSSERIQSVIVVPTRELAIQVSTNLNAIAAKIGVRIVTLCGGVDQAEQLRELDKAPQVVVATPGRLLGFLNQEVVVLSGVKQLILDEADRLLDMGFWPDLQKILGFFPSQYQTVCFSATMPDNLQTVLRSLLNDPTRIEAQAANTVVETIDEHLYLVNKGSKAQALIAQIKANDWQQVLVFISARDNADALAKKVAKAGISVAALHGDKDQSTREQTLEQFKSNQVQVLIATDILARGIHIEALPVVVNFDLPLSAPVYVHRVGRTARAGQSGIAISLVCHGEANALKAIRELTGRELSLNELEGFPVTDKPALESDDTGMPKRAKRDKQANRRSAKKRSSSQFKKKTTK
ncbi:DEAD/DEAH box helicase [Vibrio tapetis subsp. quintayensis]|uniref:DEAD/DEAH box helicase n=1 Tax=Vibrio tapetis TaxID=52443 RepID=UPI0025B5E163|nr:DEAD/DEAH box helicase [Vibrio tapetis]MDN3681852.1 DEAD/DEAH box helicase [Vibrio tapetis subsp. quintayensis]